MPALSQSCYNQDTLLGRVSAELRAWNYQTNPCKFSFNGDPDIDYEDIAKVVLVATDDWLHQQLAKPATKPLPPVYPI